MWSSTSRTSISSTPGAASSSTSSSQPGQPVLEVDGQLVGHAQPEARRKQLPSGVNERPEVEGRRLRPRHVGTLHAVPVVVELLGHRPQLGGGDAELQRQDDGALQLGAAEQLRVEGPEALVEVELGGDLVQHRQRRGEPGLDRVGGQDALREGVQRAQGGLVEVVERGAAALLHHAVAVVGSLLEQGQPDPLAQLVGRLLREGDGGDRLDGRARADERDDPARPARWSCRSRRRPTRTGWTRGRGRCCRARPRRRGGRRRSRRGPVGGRPRRRPGLVVVQVTDQAPVAVEHGIAGACAATAPTASAVSAPSGSQ